MHEHNFLAEHSGGLNDARKKLQSNIDNMTDDTGKRALRYLFYY